jgi:hypothetical protein
MMLHRPVLVSQAGTVRRMSGIIDTIRKGVEKLLGRKDASAERVRHSNDLPIMKAGFLQYTLIPLIKVVFGMVAKGLGEMRTEQESILRQVCISLERDSRATDLLGSNIQSEGVINSSSSSVNVNGVSRTRHQFLAVVRGTKSSGVVEVIAGNAPDEARKRLSGNIFSSSSQNSDDNRASKVEMCRLRVGDMMVNISVDNRARTIINV